MQRLRAILKEKKGSLLLELCVVIVVLVVSGSAVMGILSDQIESSGQNVADQIADIVNDSGESE